MQGTNVFIIGLGEAKILVDTGQGVSRFIEELVLTVKRIQCVIVTHKHQDHVGGIPDLLSAYGNVPVYKYLHESDDNFLPLTEGQKFFTEGCSLTILHTPGHTTDSICIYLAEEQAIFTGDLILGTGSTVLSDYSEYLQSMSKLLQLTPLILYPGHGQPRVSAEKITFDLNHRQNRQTQILEILVKNMSLAEITEKVYGNIDNSLLPAAQQNTLLYLKHLQDKQIVFESTGNWYKL